MLTAAIITKNEEDRIERVLQSVAFADELLVIDCGSEDRTVELARSFGATVVEADWPGHIAQKNRALSMAAGPWVLHVDADERVTEELAEEIKVVIVSEDSTVAYRMRRENWWLGAAITHGRWGRDKPIRLIKKGFGVWGGSNPHDQLRPNGPVKNLRSKIIHRPYRNIEEHFRTIDKYTTIAAKAAVGQGRKSRAVDILFRPIIYFITDYFLFLGLLNGRRGLCLAWLGSTYVVLKWWKIREIQGELS